MNKWEYKIISPAEQTIRNSTRGCQFLIDQGNDGWELVSVVMRYPQSLQIVLYYFKRPKQ